MRTWWEEMPDSVRAEIEREGLALDHLSAPEAPIDAAHIFVTDARRHGGEARAPAPLLAPGRLHLGELAEEGLEGRRPTSPRT